MATKVKSIACYVGNKKVAFAESVDVSYEKGSDDIITAEGWQGTTDGPVMGTVSLNTWETTAGENGTLVDAFLSGKPLDVRVTNMAGKTHTHKGSKIVKYDGKTEYKSNTNKGTFSIKLGAPTRS